MLASSGRAREAFIPAHVEADLAHQIAVRLLVAIKSFERRALVKPQRRASRNLVAEGAGVVLQRLQPEEASVGVAEADDGSAKDSGQRVRGDSIRAEVKRGSAVKNRSGRWCQ